MLDDISAGFNLAGSVAERSGAVASMAENWPLIDALVGGTPAMRKAGKKFLPQWPAEDDQSHNTRLSTAGLFNALDGFKSYYLIASSNDTIIAVSLFTNKSVAETSTQTLMPWIKENLGPLLASPTEAIDVTVIVSS